MNQFIVFFALIISLSSCKNETVESTEANENSEKPIASNSDWGIINDSGDAVIDDFNSWWSYQSYQIDLFGNFNPLSADSTRVRYPDFLKAIINDGLIPIKVEPINDFTTYRLYPVEGAASEDVMTTIKNQAKTALQFYDMEDTKFPEVDFTTLSGEQWNDESLKGKFVVYKTWFINCAPCIKEFPESNEFVEKYKGENVVFISLALDDEKSLKEFLKTKELKYQTVADQEDLIVNKLKLNSFPTHILVKPDGDIYRVFPDIKKLTNFIKNKGGFKLPPPPPAPPSVPEPESPVVG
ncbi:TlpA family protein disulfide reductase [Nonlabens antarcticus]|uniref:TlpA family protein disulfide reductase n=1 Tax=Nonlabens antarcticus TaxID=392714 RepID=UPI001890F574|nr:TlpA disulfide reductase family protein [Nonlabens antarcticus]